VSLPPTAEEQAAAARLVGSDGGGSGRSFEYFIKIVPATHVPLSGSPISSYVFVANTNEIVGRFRVPSVLVRYDVEAATVRFVAHREAFTDFAVNLFACLGGMLAVSGLINMAVKAAMKKMGSQAPAARHHAGRTYGEVSR